MFELFCDNGLVWGCSRTIYFILNSYKQIIVKNVFSSNQIGNYTTWKEQVVPIDLEVIVKIDLFWIKGGCQVLCEINGLSTVQQENLNMSGFALAGIILLESDGLSCSIFYF